ncbi:unnamed protein product [Gongylonema pulchrum]|uniref:40S ribosomal protein S12 n=1 Tax=Gongylonema pulchrum TaxID=637853 RepID=A0A183EUN3_9BILA|nr:unnamed protein product [Gongylonema pulchrum]
MDEKHCRLVVMTCEKASRKAIDTLTRSANSIIRSIVDESSREDSVVWLAAQSLEKINSTSVTEMPYHISGV